MEGFDAWITGRKGFQSATRASLPLFEAEGERVKVNPLVGWSAKDVLDYIREAGLPRHPLVAKGFPSIGCMPCTSAVRPGEDERAGRWRGRGKTECGIHTSAFSTRGRTSDGSVARGGFAEDVWTPLADDAPAPADGRDHRVAASAGAPNARRSRARTAPVGVAVEAGADAQAHLADLAGRPLVALAFAKFADGRAFSYARLLRDRYGFAGELRATGDVLIDEIPLMLRCGFDAFEVTNAPTLAALEAGRLPGPAIHYQPASVAGEARAGSRPWLRVDADEFNIALSSWGRAAHGRGQDGVGAADPVSTIQSCFQSESGTGNFRSILVGRCLRIQPAPLRKGDRYGQYGRAAVAQPT